ncbi:hypothetical protein DSO57_1007429 [Entomophthora muscae]|uniref:Uncharacterized protein n=1 Tax=Entomophthora muscae TaxID=34485 RepID=A0ACC2T7P1_9FUNG|nr:hypothetical protein DSO57_1007429 [Entomophthora muscae]
MFSAFPTSKFKSLFKFSSGSEASNTKEPLQSPEAAPQITLTKTFTLKWQEISELNKENNSDCETIASILKRIYERTSQERLQLNSLIEHLASMPQLIQQIKDTHDNANLLKSKFSSLGDIIGKIECELAVSDLYEWENSQYESLEKFKQESSISHQKMLDLLARQLTEEQYQHGDKFARFQQQRNLLSDLETEGQPLLINVDPSFDSFFEEDLTIQRNEISLSGNGKRASPTKPKVSNSLVADEEDYPD